MSQGEGAPTVLAADVGGTHTRLGAFRVGMDGPVPVRTETVPSDRTASFEEVLRRFLATCTSTAPNAACLAVAGPVIDGRAAMTNHPWVLDAAALSRTLSGIPTRVVNDLEAAAVAMPHLPATQLVTIAPGAGSTDGNVAVVAPGTGLGCASLCWDGAHHHPLASEGGHTDFAPRNEREIALFRYVRARHEHVSYERLLSGPGIAVLYAFLREESGGAESMVVRERLASTDDAAAVISQAATADGDPLSTATLALFASILGAKAGNLALEVLALGGVFIGGGIAPKILPHLTSGGLREAFVDKGRQRALLERMALHVVLASDTSLRGAARLAGTLVRSPFNARR
jgi:glucokinase